MRGHFKCEKFQGMGENPLKKCPECGKGARKLIGSGAGVIFKGSGFYETDYKRKSPSSGAACCGRDARIVKKYGE